MKEYQKIYEDHFRSKRSLNTCKKEFIGNSGGLEFDEYKAEIRKSILKYQKDTFDNIIKIYWLLGLYTYRGFPRQSINRNGFVIDQSYAVFMRYYVGLDHALVTHNRVNSIVMSYIEDWYPDFYAMNPFKDKIEYPYKFVTFEYLTAIYQLPERLELLDFVEKKKMLYAEFLDYMINYVGCRNDELDEKGDKDTQRFYYAFNRQGLSFCINKVK